jgi:hypothetical protein
MDQRELTRLNVEQVQAFGDRLYKAIWLNQRQSFRCSGPGKTITRQVLKELGCTQEQIDDFIIYAESQGGLCCDCEIGLNLCGGDGSDLESHHDFKGQPDSVHSSLDVHVIHKACHRTAVGGCHH